ncbi:MAG: hypothetical protein IPF54_14485 [Draconibacterium sp.]|nr:hypothetical protein [Draconibacterium sp.]
MAISVWGSNKLAKYDGNNWSAISSIDGMASVTGGVLYSLIADKSGNIWVGTSGGGISKLEQLKPDFIEITGSLVISENSEVQYMCTAHYPNGVTTDISKNVIWNVDSNLQVLIKVAN